MTSLRQLRQPCLPGLSNCTSDPILTSRMRRLEEVFSPERVAELWWPSCYQPEDKGNTKMAEYRDERAWDFVSLKLPIQSALKHALQQDFHLYRDHKFSHCLSHLDWGFYYLQLEGSSLIKPLREMTHGKTILAASS